MTDPNFGDQYIRQNSNMTAGYWGNDDTNPQAEERFEQNYRHMIECLPKSKRYFTRTHKLTLEGRAMPCNDCKWNVIHFCPTHGFDFGPLPTTFEQTKAAKVWKCAYCALPYRTVKARAKRQSL